MLFCVFFLFLDFTKRCPWIQERVLEGKACDACAELYQGASERDEERERERDGGVITSLSSGLTLHFPPTFLGSTESLIIIFLMSWSWPQRAVQHFDRCEPYMSLVPIFLVFLFFFCLSLHLQSRVILQLQQLAILRCLFLALGEIYHLSCRNAFKALRDGKHFLFFYFFNESVDDISASECVWCLFGWGGAGEERRPIKERSG